MEILIETILMSLGLVMLYFGAEWLVRGSVAIANKLKINQLVIGLTIVAFGTSTPEMAVNVSSAIQGISDVALGNVVGSNIVNIGLILGIAAIIRPIAVAKNVVRKEIPILVGVSFLLLFLSIDQSLSSTDGIILVVGIVMFTIFSYKTSKKETHIESDTGLQIVTKTLVPKAIALIGVGLGLLTIGSFVTVENAVNLAQEFGISERTIGLTLVAVGTSLPELITSVIAAKKGHADLSVGNIIGSNIFNILAILGVSSVITGIAVSDAIWTDYYVMIGFALVLIPIMRTGFIISRIEGIILLIGYVVYSVFLFVK
ncbi:MAG: calcium/sodium antiporter [Nitrosopumilus sp.]|nr:calcium/sodium antiporter [Nitrosopumilus sp.]